MPIIGIEEYVIDFRIIPTNDMKTIVLLDLSKYISVPEKPLIEVRLPGYTGSVEFTYAPGNVVVITSDKLSLTYSTDLGATVDLPDGVYEITMKVCPYDQLFSKKCYLKTTKLESNYQLLLLSLDVACNCMEERKLKEELIDIEILIQSSKAEADICNTEKATIKYSAAVKKLASLTKKLNC